MIRIAIGKNALTAAHEIKRQALLRQCPVYVRRSDRGYAVEDRFQPHLAERYIGTYTATASVLDIAADIVADR